MKTTITTVKGLKELGYSQIIFDNMYNRSAFINTEKQEPRGFRACWLLQ